MKTVFSQPRFTGARFDEHTLPVDVARDLLAYEILIIDVARRLYLQDHPGRQRMPKGFAENFHLDIERIEAGSAKPVLALVIAGALPLQGGEPDYFVRARDLIAECVAAQNGTLPENFPKESLRHFNHFGCALRENEALELALPDGKHVAVLTPEKRKRLVLAANQVYEREVDLSGYVEEADFAKLSFRLSLSDSGTATVCSLPVSFQHIVRNYNGRSRHHIHIKGIGTFDAADHLQKVIMIESMELVKNVALSSRFDEIALLEDGWFDGAGKAPDADALARVAEKLIADFPENVPLPQVVPKQDGNLLLEWQAEGDPSLDIDLTCSQASFHAFRMDDSDMERDFTLDEAGWQVLFAFLCEHIRVQQP